MKRFSGDLRVFRVNVFGLKTWLCKKNCLFPGLLIDWIDWMDWMDWIVWIGWIDLKDWID